MSLKRILQEMKDRDLAEYRPRRLTENSHMIFRDHQGHETTVEGSRHNNLTPNLYPGPPSPEERGGPTNDQPVPQQEGNQ